MKTLIVARHGNHIKAALGTGLTGDEEHRSYVLAHKIGPVVCGGLTRILTSAEPKALRSAYIINGIHGGDLEQHDILTSTKRLWLDTDGILNLIVEKQHVHTLVLIVCRTYAETIASHFLWRHLGRPDIALPEIEPYEAHIFDCPAKKYYRSEHLAA